MGMIVNINTSTIVHDRHMHTIIWLGGATLLIMMGYRLLAHMSHRECAGCVTKLNYYAQVIDNRVGRYRQWEGKRQARHTMRGIIGDLHQWTICTM